MCGGKVASGASHKDHGRSFGASIHSQKGAAFFGLARTSHAEKGRRTSLLLQAGDPVAFPVQCCANSDFGRAPGHPHLLSTILLYFLQSLLSF